VCIHLVNPSEAKRVIHVIGLVLSAMLSAMASYGPANLFLEEQWQLMGALEALNGMLLFGLTTAFLFAMIRKVWPLGSRGRHWEA
jgi:hypothetical protein